MEKITLKCGSKSVVEGCVFCNDKNNLRWRTKEEEVNKNANIVINRVPWHEKGKHFNCDYLRFLQEKNIQEHRFVINWHAHISDRILKPRQYKIFAVCNVCPFKIVWKILVDFG